MLRIGCAIVVEQLVIRADLLVYLVHVHLNDSGKGIIVRVARFSCLEEDIRVLSASSLAGMIGIQRMLTECVDRIHIRHILQILVIPGLDLLDLMGGTESIEEIDEGKASLDRSEMCHGGQVHNLLHAAFAEHGASGLTAGIYVGMISENAQRVGSDRSRGNVEHTGKLLTGDLVEVGNHQKQTLRCRIGGRQSTCCQGTVNGTSRTGLGLHLRNLYGLSEHVLSVCCRPFIGSFCHRG